MVSDWTRLGLAFHHLLSFISGKNRNTSKNPPGVIVGHTRQNKQNKPVIWPAPSSELASHGAVWANSGAGKTVLAVWAVLQEILDSSFLESPMRPTLVAVDPKGDLDLLLSGLSALAPDLLDRINYLHPFKEGFAFNFLKQESVNSFPDIQAVQLASLCAEVSTARGSQRHLGVGARQVDALEHLLLATLTCDHPQVNVLWTLDALRTKKGMKQLAKLTTSPRAQQFLNSAPFSEELKASTAARLRGAFAATNRLEAMVSADSCIDFSELLAPGKINLISLKEPPVLRRQPTDMI